MNPGLEDLSGDSVFVRDEAGQIFHTYSTYGRGGEEFLGIYRYLDATPKRARRERPVQHSRGLGTAQEHVWQRRLGGGERALSPAGLRLPRACDRPGGGARIRDSK